MGIRCFAAIELTEAIRRGLAGLGADLRKSGADAKWVEPANLHVTIKFLGQVDEADLPRVRGIMDDAVRGVEPFSLRIAGAGSFPSGRRPRVVWVGAREAGERLSGIHRRLERGLRQVRVAADGRPFVAHVTLGRLRSGQGADRVAEVLVRWADREFGDVTVEALTLVESVLKSTGPVYTSLYHAALGRS